MSPKPLSLEEFFKSFETCFAGEVYSGSIQWTSLADDTIKYVDQDTKNELLVGICIDNKSYDTISRKNAVLSKLLLLQDLIMKKEHQPDIDSDAHLYVINGCITSIQSGQSISSSGLDILNKIYEKYI